MEQGSDENIHKPSLSICALPDAGHGPVRKQSIARSLAGGEAPLMLAAIDKVSAAERFLRGYLKERSSSAEAHYYSAMCSSARKRGKKKRESLAEFMQSKV